MLASASFTDQQKVEMPRIQKCSGYVEQHEQDRVSDRCSEPRGSISEWRVGKRLVGGDTVATGRHG